MKKQAYLLIACFVLVSFAAVAQAQTTGSIKMVARIPFEFRVGNKTLPAGEYTVVKINPASDRAVLEIASEDRSATVIVSMMTVIGKTRGRSYLLFHRYGNRCFFSESWIDGEGSGLQAPKSRSEHSAQRESAGVRPTNETVALTTRN